MSLAQNPTHHCHSEESFDKLRTTKNL